MNAMKNLDNKIKKSKNISTVKQIYKCSIIYIEKYFLYS